MPGWLVRGDIHVGTYTGPTYARGPPRAHREHVHDKPTKAASRHQEKGALAAPDIGSVHIEHEEDCSSQPHTHCRRRHPSWPLLSGRLIALFFFFFARACVPCCPLFVGRARGNEQRLVRDSITASPRYCMSRRMAAEGCHTFLSLALPKVCMYVGTRLWPRCCAMCCACCGLLCCSVLCHMMPCPCPGQRLFAGWPTPGCWICALCGCVCASL